MRYILFIIFCLNAKSEQLELTLKSAIEMGIKTSPNASIISEAKKQSEESYRAFESSLYPQLSMNVSVPGAIREINQITQNDGTQRFLQQSQLYSSAGLNISQNIPYLGTNIALFSGLTRLDIIEPTKSQIWRTTPVQLSLSQPIFSFNSLYWDKEIQELQSSNIGKQYIEEIEELSINITNTFFDFFIAKKNLENATKNASLNDSLFNISKGRYSVGKIAENDLLQSELALLNARNNVEKYKIDFENTKNKLKILLNLERDVSIELIAPDDIPDIDVDPVKAYEKFLENSSNIANFLITEKQAERDLDRARKQNLVDYGFRLPSALDNRPLNFPEFEKKFPPLTNF